MVDKVVNTNSMGSNSTKKVNSANATYSENGSITNNIVLSATITSTTSLS